MNEIIAYPIFILAALVASGFVVLFMGATLDIVSRFGTRVLPWVFPLIGASVVFGVLASNRNVDLYVRNPAFSYGGNSGLTVWVLRACAWPILTLCGSYILASFFSPRREKLSAKPLYVSFLTYFICGSLLNGVFGSNPALDYKMFYVPLVVTAFYIGQAIPVERLILYAKTTAFISILFGLVAAVFYPVIAIQTNFRSVLIPWPPIRLWGLDSHANTLGPMVVMALLLELGSPYRYKSLHWGALTCGGVALFLTQSKTAWVAFIVASLTYGVLNFFSGAFGEVRNFRIKAKTFLMFLVAGCAFFGLGIYLIYGDAGKRIARFMATSDGASISSMTGRDVIWDITLAEWKNNILFGYGPDLWGKQFSAKYNLLGIASNAHNQLVDIIGSSGLFGISAFAIYYFFLVKYAFVSKKIVGWLPVALLIALSVRAIPEVPFKLINLTSNDFAFHLILLVIIFGSINRLKSAGAPTLPTNLNAGFQS